MLKNAGMIVRTSIMAICAVLATHIEAETLKGVVTSQENGNHPVPGVLVGFDHTIYRTFTDSTGSFSLDIPEIGIGQHHSQSKNLKSFSITYNQRVNSIFLSKTEGVLSLAMYRLDGKEIVKKQINPKETRILVPQLPSGLYLLRLLFSNGATYCGTMLSTPAAVIRKSSLQIYKNEKTAGTSVPTGHKMIFRHDNFYPVDKEYTGIGDTLCIGMKADPRAAFFDDSRVHTMCFTMTNQDSMLMEHNAIDEQYAPAEFTCNGITAGTVGVRYKGSDFYAMPRCFDDEGNRSSYADCRNVSLKVKFDEYNDTARFYSMKKLNLHSMSYDDSKMREMFAYKLFRDMGIYTCRTVFVKVYINNVYRGLFTAVESIDGRFTKSRWPEYGDGNMYKEKWPWKTTGVAYYKANGALVTNEDMGDSIWPIRMVDLAKAINASTPQDFRANVSPFMDLDYFVNYIVVDRAIHNSDGIMAWYWEKSWQGNHNYFFYEEENKGGKAWIIPWDLNSTLYPTDMIIDQYDIPDWNEAPDSCQPFLAWGGSYIMPPNCIKLINLTAASCWGQFKLAGKYYLEHIFTKERMRAHLKKLTTLIAPVMDDDPWITKTEWEKEIRYFDASIDKLYSGFDDHLNGREQSVNSSSFYKEIDPDSGFSVTYCNNFEFIKPVSAIDWIFTEISENSIINFSIDTLAPSWGKGSLKVQFVFNPVDTSKTYAEWSYTGLKLKQVSDFSTIDSIRICICSDVPRECWITLQSDLYKQLSVENGRYGWNIMATKKNQQFSCAIENAVFPDWVGTADPEKMDTVLTSVSGIGISVSPQYESNGKLRIVPDSGMVRIDNIEFIMKKP
jgi:hypothetical protein